MPFSNLYDNGNIHFLSIILSKTQSIYSVPTAGSSYYSKSFACTDLEKIFFRKSRWLINLGAFKQKTSGQQQGKPFSHPLPLGYCTTARSSNLIVGDAAFKIQAICWRCLMACYYNSYNSSPRQQTGTVACGTRDRTDILTLPADAGYLWTRG